MNGIGSPLVAVVQRYYEAFGAGDLPALLDFWPDAVHRRPGSGSIEGTAALERFFRARIAERDSHTCELMVSAADWVIVRGECGAKGIGFADFFHGRERIAELATYDCDLTV